MKPEIRWLPFQLNPGHARRQGIPRADYRKAKFGSIERARGLDARVAVEGEGEGIAFAFDRMERTPNTVAAHQLIDLAQKQGRGTPVVDALFKAYFEEARDIGDPAVLAEIAAARRRERLAAAGRRQAGRGAGGRRARPRHLGVPTFIFERKLGVSGAYPPEALAQAIREAVASDDGYVKSSRVSSTMP